MSLGLVWLTAYCLVASTASPVLRRPPIRRLLGAITGVVLVGFGVRLVTESR